MIEDIIFFLDDKFEESDFDIGFFEGVQKYIIFTNNYNLYRSKKFINIVKVLRKKYKDVKFFCAYKSRLYV